MRIVDCHVHIFGEVDPSNLLREMDAGGVDRILAISKSERVSLIDTRRNLLDTKKLMDAAPERIGGLAWINPTIPGATGLAEEALTDMGYVGVKIIPDHFFIYEERLEPFWEKMDELRASILFHTGILYAYDDSSRFCRPLWLEKLLHYPRIRFAMAHISWPWCEECLAVMGRMRAVAHDGEFPWQSYVDLTPGTPRHIRKEAVANAIDFCGAERLMFGSDTMLPNAIAGLEGDFAHQRALIGRDLALFDELGLDERAKERIMSGAADELFGKRK